MLWGVLPLGALTCFLMDTSGWAAAAQPKMPVDLELVLAVDVSASMDPGEQRLQRNGYVAALRSPKVIDAIRSGPLGRIAVTYVEWGGPTTQIVILPWTLIDGPASAESTASKLAAAPIERVFDTSIANALKFSAGLFANSAFSGERQAIDISGDGPNNTGPPVLSARDAVLGLGITINGLPIMTKIESSGGLYSISGLDTYYSECVIGGPGAFVVVVKRPERFADAIERKLILEVSDIVATNLVPVADVQRTVKVDCLAGEKNSGRNPTGAVVTEVPLCLNSAIFRPLGF